jgi:hypothetical protein
MPWILAVQPQRYAQKLATHSISLRLKQNNASAWRYAENMRLFQRMVTRVLGYPAPGCGSLMGTFSADSNVRLIQAG